MSDLAVTERRIRPIQDAAAARNWKQALQLCDKWQKKGENSDRFLALKASVYINQPESAQIERGKQETLKLCSRSKPVTDIEALYQLQSSLKQLSLQNEEGPKLWERAVSAVPGDKSLMTTWLNRSLSDSNWLMAQKAAMALRKSFPKERQYEFWNILFCYLAHKDLNLPDKDRTLYGMLAYRLITKAAEAVPKDTVLSPGNAISTIEELALLLQIYLSTSHADEAITILQSETTGLRSRIAENDVTMALSLLLGALSASENVSATLKICQQLLADESLPVTNLVDEDRIWKSVVKAGSTPNTDDWTKSLDIVESALKKHPSCRAAHRAKLSLLQPSNNQGEHGPSALVAACQDYIARFKTKPFCFEDLCSSLQQLDASNLQKLLSDLSTDDNSSNEKLFSLKVTYLLLGKTRPKTEGTLKFATQAINLSQRLPEAGNERPEAALLAALSLLRLAAFNDSIDLAVQACLIMEATYSKYGEYYPLAVRLLQAYRSIGLMSLATKKFISLSVKNMQWETVSHLLLTRASTLHPVASGRDENSLNPLYALDTALEMLDNMDQSLDKAIQKGLGFGSYANVLDTVGVKRDVQRSLNRQVYIIEERRIQHLVGVPVDSFLEPWQTPLIDLRDSSFLNNYGISDGILEDFLACGGLPGQTWLNQMSFADHLRQYLKFDLGGQPVLAAISFENLKKLSKDLSTQVEEKQSGLTAAESRSLNCWLRIFHVIDALQSSGTDQTAVDKDVERVIAWLKPSGSVCTKAVNDIQIPGWEYLHSSFSEMETLQITSLFAAALAKKAKSAKGKVLTVSKEKIFELQGSISEAVDAVRNSVKSLKDGINTSGVLSQLIDAGAGGLEAGPLSQRPEYKELAKECNSLFDEIFLEEVCGSMRESWDDALDGLMAITVKVAK